jgi:hypothetical protein
MKAHFTTISLSGCITVLGGATSHRGGLGRVQQVVWQENWGSLLAPVRSFTHGIQRRDESAERLGRQYAAGVHEWKDGTR